MEAHRIFHSIEELQPARYAEANALIHSRLGADCCIPLDAPAPHLFIAAYFLNDTLAGVGTAEIKPDGSGYLGNAAVAERYSGNGIGTQIVRRRVEWLRERGVPYITADAWASRFGVGAAKPLVRNGFSLVGVTPNHYAFCLDCPACKGEESCRCSAWRYRLNLRVV